MHNFLQIGATKLSNYAEVITLDLFLSVMIFLHQFISKYNQLITVLIIYEINKMKVWNYEKNMLCVKNVPICDVNILIAL